jgi:hypothetical protein
MGIMVSTTAETKTLTMVMTVPPVAKTETQQST